MIGKLHLKFDFSLTHAKSLGACGICAEKLNRTVTVRAVFQALIVPFRLPVVLWRFLSVVIPYAVKARAKQD